MNPAHVHLVFNHFPVVTTALGLLLLLWARMRDSGELKRAALGVFVLGALLAVPAYFSGEPAEERVENLPGVSKPLIEEHEEAAETAAVTIAVLGLLAAAALCLDVRRQRVPGALGVALVVVAIATAVLMARAAHLGGRIHHPEIREQAAPARDAGMGGNRRSGGLAGARRGRPPGQEVDPTGSGDTRSAPSCS
jgi:uncharacterized membrane protein